MNTDPASLDNLREIVELPPVSWWPLALGWWIVIIALGIIAMAAVLRAWKRWNTNAYRRAALQELESVSTVAAIEDILKRTALCAYPRTQIASLSGSKWCQWLGETGGASVPLSVRRSLTQDIFKDRNSANTAETMAYATMWITHHKPESEGRKTTRK